MTVLQIVKARMSGEAVPTDDVLLMLSVDEVEQAIKNYCNIDIVPDALKFIWANMAIDLVRYHNASNNQDSNGLENINVGEISSLKIGDTTINIGDGSGVNASNRAIKSHIPNLDEIVLNNKEQLNKFRRMVW